MELVGPQLRVDARPAQLVAQLRGSDGGPVVTARPAGGPTRTESVPTGARQVTCRVSDELSVEATRAADFVALAGEGGRRLVVAFTGEVTVLPAGGAGDRFALAAHEAFLLRDHGAEPKVVPVAALSEEEQAEVTSVVEAAAAVVLAPVGAAAAAAEATTEMSTQAPTKATEMSTQAPTKATDAAATGAPAEARDAAPPTSPAPVAPKAEPAQKT
ncbi:MAG: hypothetical protein M3P34_10995, partial [Actinomycetota bacterium]|nr:hypothetical protein [Actinomycetota bacterium]